jgi:hypothetical protein
MLYVAVGFERGMQYGAVTRKTALSKRDVRGVVCLLNDLIKAGYELRLESTIKSL